MFADYFDVLRACVLMARIRAHDATTMLTPEALELATMGGARALGLDREIGSIEAGKRADLVVLDYRAFGLTPTLDPVQNLVYHAHAKDVETVLVDGRVVVDERRLVHADGAALVDAAQDAATAAWSRFVAKYGGIMARIARRAPRRATPVASSAELRARIKVCMFDQYGTVVDMQAGLTEAVAARTSGPRAGRAIPTRS